MKATMPRARALSGMGMEGKEPHSVSLKGGPS